LCCPFILCAKVQPVEEIEQRRGECGGVFDQPHVLASGHDDGLRAGDLGGNGAGMAGVLPVSCSPVITSVGAVMARAGRISSVKPEASTCRHCA